MRWRCQLGSTAMSRAPYWERIYNDVRAQITSGQLKPGQQLPSETQMIAAYAHLAPTGVSAKPVRRALRQLQDDGWIEGHRGVGNFVANRDTPTA